MTPAERKQWLENRRGGIGSSDAPNLLGVGWRNAGDVYRSKVEPVDERLPRAGILRRGLDLEPMIAQRYEEVTEGTELAKPLEVFAHPERPWQKSSLDRIRDDGRPVELKSTAGFGEGWGPAGTDLIPDDYQVQTQHQMGVIGADWCDVAALDVIAWEFRVYRIPFSPEFFAFLTAIESQFWTEHVLTNTPPGAEWGEQFEEATRARMVRGSRVNLDHTAAAELCERRKEMLAIKAEADAAADALTFEIGQLLGTAEEGTALGWKMKRVHISGAVVNYTRNPYDKLDIRQIKGKRR